MTPSSAMIELSSAAHETIASETAKHLPMEVGGVLLGYREGNSVVVTHARVVQSQHPEFDRYVRDDVRANALLAEFLAERAVDDPTGYVGEWHSHPTPSGPSPMDFAAIRATAKASAGPVALIVHAPGGEEVVSGLIARRRRLGGVTVAVAVVTSSRSRFEPLGVLPSEAVRRDGPVFISYRQWDGTRSAESLEDLLRAAGLVVWRDRTDLRAGTTTDRLEQALTEGLSAAVLIVTPDVVNSEIVRERELPRLLLLDENPSFSLCIANKIARAGHESKCDFEAPDRLLRLVPARTLADKKQSNILDDSGEVEIVRDLLMHRTEQRKRDIREKGRAFSIRVQTRPTPFALDAGDEDLHIRLKSADEGRLPSLPGLRRLQTTLPLISDSVYSSGAKGVRLSGGAHLSVALALGAALPDTKIGYVEVVDVHDDLWACETTDDPFTNQLRIEILRLERPQPASTSERVAVFVSLTPSPDRGAFEGILCASDEGFTAATILSLTGTDRIDSREGARLSSAVALEIKRLAARSGRAEVHLAFHGPFAMAALIGRHLNTLRVVVYEWDPGDSAGPSYQPVLVLESGIARGPITKVFPRL